MIRGYEPIRVTMHNHFWHSSQTLSITYAGDFWYWGNQGSQIVFQNLTNLRLQLSHAGAIGWVTDTWNLPVLKNLSISGIQDYIWISFLNKVCPTIERLQITRNILQITDSILGSGIIVMPKLKELHLIDEEGSTMPAISDWNTRFTCPRLHKVVLLMETIVITRGLGRSPAVTYLNDVRDMHRSIKEIELIGPLGKWVHTYQEDHRVVLLMKDIMDWLHEGLTVNITTGKDGMKERYTNDHSSFDTQIAPGDYPIDRTQKRLDWPAGAVVVSF
jgi:hypothetical protein